MVYGNLTLHPETGSISITTRKSQLVRHYPSTDISDKFALGKQPTVIKCVLIAPTEEQRFLIEQVLQGESELELHFDNYYYKKVITGEMGEPKPSPGGIYHIDAEFIALDPIPYHESSGEAIY